MPVRNASHTSSSRSSRSVRRPWRLTGSRIAALVILAIGVVLLVLLLISLALR